MIIRMITVIHAYDQARGRGEKHSSAVAEAVAAVKSSYPDMKISETVVKRILAEHQPKDAPTVACVTEKTGPLPPLSPEDCKLLGLPEGTAFKRSLIFGYGPKPKYPRANAAKSKANAIGKLTSG